MFFVKDLKWFDPQFSKHSKFSYASFLLSLRGRLFVLSGKGGEVCPAPPGWTPSPYRGQVLLRRRPEFLRVACFD